MDGHPGRSFRFSGFDPESPGAVTRYNDRLRMSDIGDATGIFRRYVTLLESAGYDETRTWPYAYDHFDDGSPISGRARRLYRRLGSGAGSPRGGPEIVALDPGTMAGRLVRGGRRYPG